MSADSRISDERLDTIEANLGLTPTVNYVAVNREEVRALITELRERRAQEVTVTNDAVEAMAMYNTEVEALAKLEASLIRLSDTDRQLLRMIVPSIDQRSREPGDAWNEAAALLWLLIDTTDPVAGFPRAAAPAPPPAAGVTEEILERGARALHEAWDKADIPPPKGGYYRLVRTVIEAALTEPKP